MTTDLERALQQIAAAGQRDARAVPVGRLLTRLHRRRAARDVTVSVVGVGAAAGLVLAGAVTFGPPPPGPVPATQSSVPTPTSEPSPSISPAAPQAVAGWQARPAPCGEPVAFEEVDSPVLALHGEVTVGTFDPVTARYTPAQGGRTVHIDVTAHPQTPGQAVDGFLEQHTYLVDADGSVALWDVPSDEMPPAATDGSGASAVAWLYDAVDCRTGQPLDGTYRVLATASVVGTPEFPGPAVAEVEVVELAPVTFGPDGTAPAPRSAGPACGEPLPSDLLDGRDQGLVVTLDPGVRLDRLSSAGVHVSATVTRAEGADGSLSGVVPQTMRALLVDGEGTVVSQPGPWSPPSAKTFDLAPGESFTAPVFQWFGSCGLTTAEIPPGDYEMYVYQPLTATDEDGTSERRAAAGGPFPVTLTGW